MQECPLHKEKCKNFRIARPRLYEFGYDGVLFGMRCGDLNTIDDFINISKAQCPFTKMFALIIIARRMSLNSPENLKRRIKQRKTIKFDQAYLDEFFSTLEKFYWLFHEQASLRVKLSIIDTIADYGRSPIQKANATLITTFFRMEVISITTSEPRDELWENRIWNSVEPVFRGFPDTIENMLMRITRSLEQTPYLANLFHGMFLEVLDNTSIARYAAHCKNQNILDKFKEIVALSDKVKSRLP
jgi:hypothetical protein